MTANSKIKIGEPHDEHAVNRKVLDNLGVSVFMIDEDVLAEMDDTLRNCGIIVDALLGTGLDRPVEGVYQQIIQSANLSGRPVLAVDIPSGVNSDNGQIMGSAIRAVRTVTFGKLKAGLLCFPGAQLAGEINLVDIGMPSAQQMGLSQKTTRFLSSANYVSSLLPIRPQDSHKGTFGYALAIAGSLEYKGAAHLTSLSALRTGAGMSILATPHSLVAQMPAGEIIYRGIEETPAGSISSRAIEQLQKEIETVSSVVLGPGLSLNPDTVDFVQKFIRLIDKPCVVDADALNAIAKDPRSVPRGSGEFVFTPHPKELSRLMNVSVEEIQGDRLAYAQEAATRYGVVVVLKGAHTVIAGQDGTLFVNPTGNAAMATAGAGDVLSGVIGAFLAQSMSPLDAAVAGTYLHGLAGDLAAEQIGQAGLVAGDLANFLPAAMTVLHSGEFPGSALEQRLLM